MYLQFHSVKEPSKNHDVWVRVLFGSFRGSFRSGSCTFLLSGSIRFWAKPVVLIWFVLAGFGFFPLLPGFFFLLCPTLPRRGTSLFSSTFPLSFLSAWHKKFITYSHLYICCVLIYFELFMIPVMNQNELCWLCSSISCVYCVCTHLHYSNCAFWLLINN